MSTKVIVPISWPPLVTGTGIRAGSGARSIVEFIYRERYTKRCTSWLSIHIAPANVGVWKIEEPYIVFENDEDATYFTLMYDPT